MSPAIDADWVSGASGPPTRVVRLRVKRARAYPPRKSSGPMIRYPITLSFAKEVGQLTNELSKNQVPSPSYRFYMDRSNQRHTAGGPACEVRITGAAHRPGRR